MVAKMEETGPNDRLSQPCKNVSMIPVGCWPGPHHVTFQSVRRLVIVWWASLYFIALMPAILASEAWSLESQPSSKYLSRDVVVVVQGTLFPLRMTVQQYVSAHKYKVARWEHADSDQWILRLKIEDQLTRQAHEFAFMFVSLKEGPAVNVTRIVVDDVMELSPTEVAQYSFAVMGKIHKDATIDIPNEKGAALIESSENNKPPSHELTKQGEGTPPVKQQDPDLKKSYLARIQARISGFWTAPPVDISGKSLSVTVRFRLMRDGRVGSVVIEKSSGNDYYDMAAQRAVQSAIPFPPFPPDLPDPYLDGSFTFAVGDASSSQYHQRNYSLNTIIFPNELS